MPLPRGVFRVRRGARVYWYFQARRGKPDRGPLVRLPEPGTPEFHRALADLTGKAMPAAPRGSFAALAAAYQASPKWSSLRPATREAYERYIGVVLRWWGPLAVDGLTAEHIATAVEREFAKTPTTGNMVLATIRALMSWGAARGFPNRAPARDVDELETHAKTTRPWPEAAWRKIVTEAPAPIARLAVLGRATGQRISDLIRMRPVDRDGAGVALTITKLGDREHWCPLPPDLARMIDGWRVFPATCYVHDERGRPMTDQVVRRRFRLACKALGLPGLKIHGLRALAVCDLRIDGQPHQQIAAAIGMSVPMVMHYSKHIDQRLAATGGGKKARN